ncbi:unnamed protein product [Adineta ricciae]|nr:unnamed protein product [Adineta ricciae]
MAFNQSILPLTVAWNGKRFAESKSARMAARRSIFRASTIMLNTEWKILESQNNEICREINRCRADLQKYDDKLQVLDNMTHLATQSLEVYFQARMENLRTFVTEQCRIISDGIQEEADHWKEIHAMLQQKLVVPGDLRSYGGGNGLPRAVKQSPNFSRIAEEDEEEDQEENEDETTDMDKTKNRTTLRKSRTFTPLITQSLKKARLLASKLSQDTSMILPPQLSVSTAVHEETINEEPPPASAMIPEAHVTLPDVSVIEKAAEMNHEIPNSELSVSLLPCLPTAILDEENGSEDEEKPYSNKSIASTISDKTFVKTSLKPFSSDEESDDEDDEDTIIESSLIADNTENARPLLLTADRSIRRPAHPPSLPPVREEDHGLIHPPIIKQEKVSFREPLPVDPNVSNRTLLLNKTTFDAEESDFIRPTIDENCNISKLPTIPSADSNEVENEKDDTVQEPQGKLADVEIPITEAKTCASPVLEPMPASVPPVENNTKRRTTRRTTTRLLRENQNDNLPAQAPAELPKTRYATRYSTRLASSASNEEVIITRRSTMHRRTTRFTSE